MVSLGLGSDVSNDLSTIFNTWKLPDISSLHNVIRTGIQPRKADANFIFSKDKANNPPVQHQMNGGAERDRTADPLLAKQVLSQLSYSPISSIAQDTSRVRQHSASTAIPSSQTIIHIKQMVGPGRLELPTPRLSSVCSNQLSYGPIRGTGRYGFLSS